ncbi:MAG TPA: hypothetical protein VEX86_20495 [Longimicrobium sp.]|nr:hypothetical protein [Longimicrobium sp.]
MDHDEVPPIRPGKMFKGGWNPDGPRPDPDFVPAPFGIPFAPPVQGSPPVPARHVAPAGCRPVSTEVPPIRPGKMFKGGWNREVVRRDNDFIPAPFGIPFAPPPA